MSNTTQNDNDHLRTILMCLESGEITPEIKESLAEIKPRQATALVQHAIITYKPAHILEELCAKLQSIPSGLIILAASRLNNDALHVLLSSMKTKDLKKYRNEVLEHFEKNKKHPYSSIPFNQAERKWIDALMTSVDYYIIKNELPAKSTTKTNKNLSRKM